MGSATVDSSPADAIASPDSNSNKGDKTSKSETDQYGATSETKTSFSDYLRIFTYSTWVDRCFLGLAAFAEIGTGATLPLLNVVFGNLTGSFASYFTPGSTTTKSEFQRDVNKQTLYIVYLFIARWVLSYLSIFVFRIVGIRISAKLRLEYLKALFCLPVAVLDTMPSGQASNTITTAANVLQVGISEKLGLFFQFSSLLVTSIVIAFKYSWALTLVTSSVLVFIALVYGVLLPIIVKMNKAVEFADGKAASIAGEVLGSIRMIVACGAEDRIATRYSGWIQESRRRGLRQAPVIGLQYAPVFFSIYATMALCFWFGFKLLQEGHISSISTIVIVLMAVMMLAMSIAQTAAPIVAATKAATAATEFFTIIDLQKPSTAGVKAPEVTAAADIAFNLVNFAYPSRPGVKILDDLNIEFEAGKVTAIVGASGSGKSTIVGLLERWYQLDDQSRLAALKIPEPKKEKKSEDDEKTPNEDASGPPVAISGTITVGGRNLQDIDLKWWRSQIGLVQQEPFIFNDTIAKNVEYGLIGSRWEDESEEVKQKLVEEACKEAFADEFIVKLPMGYKTQVGDAGIKLSGGQRQRLAIARSCVRRPAILILDEATSAIDVRGEKLVQAALDRVSEGRTTITIAHRLSTIKKADKIVVMKKGRLIEQGTHESLLSDTDGAYWALVNAQKITAEAAGETEEDTIELAAPTEELMRKKTTSGESEIAVEEEKAYKRKSLITSFGLFLFEQSHNWQWYALQVTACMAAGATYPIQAWLFGQIIQVFEQTGQALINASNHWSLMFFILALASGVAYYTLGWSASIIATEITCTYRQEYFESILAKPIKFFDAEENSSGTLTARVANDPTQLQQLLGINGAMVMMAIFNLTGCIIIAMVFGWKLALLTTFVALPLIMVGGFFRMRFETQFEAMNQAVFAESSKFAAESITAFRTVTSLTLEDMITRRYDKLLNAHVKAAFLKGRFTSIVFAFSDSIALLCIALTFWYGGTLMASREYDALHFFVVYIALTNGAESAGNTLSFGPNMAQATAAANRILAFRNRDASGQKATHLMPDADGGAKIELRNIWFKYPTRDIPIFTGLNLTIEKGQFAALVGPSGCGKTSIVSLLERFYAVQKGKILCNGIDITELDVADYRKSISLVAQEPTLFQGTVKDNVLLGVDEDTSDERLHQACRDAEIHEFITSLPDGYNTDVGVKGVSLSGGQKQRIAIARALIRNPTMLLLDEATSSLDSESEKLVQAAFERAGKGRTMIVVAHRLATVQNADIIFVLGEGGLLEQGDHNSLLRKRGVYYQMCQSQALDR